MVQTLVLVAVELLQLCGLTDLTALCGVCVCVCVYLFSPSFSFFPDLMDLMYSSTSTPGHVCLAEPTRGGWLVPPPSACLLTCLVWSGQMPADSLALFFFPSPFWFYLFLMTGMDGLYHPYFLHVFPLFFLFLCAFPAPPPPLLLVIWHFGELSTILPGSLVLLHVRVPVSLFESQTGNLGNIADICCCGEGKVGRGLIMRSKRSYNFVQEEGIMSCMCY